MNERTFDQLLAAWIERGPTVAPDRVSAEARREIGRTQQSAPAVPWVGRRFADMSMFAKLGVAGAIVIAIAVLGVSLLIAPNIGNPGPTPTPTWTGPVRTDLGMAAVTRTALSNAFGFWDDPAGDAAMGWVDITRVQFDEGNAGHWNIGLGDWPPPATGSDGADLVIAHGLVLDTTGDGEADYVAGVENDPTQQGEFRAWVTNLATGETTEQIGPPYGYPVEFGHSAGGEIIVVDGVAGETRPQVALTFLDGTEPADLHLESVRWYVWASATEAGEVVAWDYAPDAAWLGAEWVSRWPGTSDNPAGVYGTTVSPNTAGSWSRFMRTGYRDLTFAAVDGAAADCFAGADGPEPVPVTIGGVNGMYVEPYGDPSVQVTQPQGDGTTTAAYALPFEDQTLCVYLSWDADISAEELEAARQVVESIRGHRHRAGVQFILTLPAGWHTG